MTTAKRFLSVFRGEAVDRPPFWYMRQAGRYLPEYRELRRTEPDFLAFCYCPELTVEAALQPIRRFGMDAAIVFSDILVLCDAVGASVQFVEDRGPVLTPIRTRDAIDALRLDDIDDALSPVCRSISVLRERLPEDCALIGFAGSPWTLAVYMVEGQGGTQAPAARRWAYADPAAFGRLIELLTEAAIRFLDNQIRAGAEVVQLFDSWAGLLPEDQFQAWVIEPTARIVDELHRRWPQVPIIGFPRGAGALYEPFVMGTGVDGVSLDPTVPLGWAVSALQERCVVQGNLDNERLVAGTDLEATAGHILDVLAPGGMVFNLGHGILPATPPAHVAQLSAYLRSWSMT